MPSLDRTSQATTSRIPPKAMICCSWPEHIIIAGRQENLTWSQLGNTCGNHSSRHRISHHGRLGRGDFYFQMVAGGAIPYMKLLWRCHKKVERECHGVDNDSAMHEGVLKARVYRRWRAIWCLGRCKAEITQVHVRWRIATPATTCYNKKIKGYNKVDYGTDFYALMCLLGWLI
jgi:hypothetical protein